MVEVDRDLCRSSGLTSLLKRDQLQPVAQDRTQISFNVFRDGGCTISPGNLFLCSVILRVNKCFLIFKWTFLCFSLCPLPVSLSLKSGSCLFTPSLQVLMYINKIPPSLLFSKMTSHSSLSLSAEMLHSPNHCGPSLDSLQHANVSHTGQNWKWYSRCGLTGVE